jgi:hypothetical protein
VGFFWCLLLGAIKKGGEKRGKGGEREGREEGGKERGGKYLYLLEYANASLVQHKNTPF